MKNSNIFCLTGMFVLSVAFIYAGPVIKVVTTLPDLKSITELIGGEKTNVFSIATGYQNPHFVTPEPGFSIKLSEADMFVTIGLDMESGWMPSLLSSSRNAKIQKGSKGYVDASTGIPLLQVPSSASREEGDIHIFGNPHYWLDPVRGKQIAKNICDALTKMSPENLNYFESNLEAFNEKIDAKVKEWTEKLQKYKDTKVLAYHNEWCYFEERFGLKIIDFLEPKPGTPPTPYQMNKNIEEAKNNKIKIIISSPCFTSSSAEVINKKAGTKFVVLATSVGADPSIKNYFDLFEYNISKLLQALK